MLLDLCSPPRLVGFLQSQYDFTTAAASSLTVYVPCSAADDGLGSPTPVTIETKNDPPGLPLEVHAALHGGPRSVRLLVSMVTGVGLQRPSSAAEQGTSTVRLEAAAVVKSYWLCKSPTERGGERESRSALAASTRGRHEPVPIPDDLVGALVELDGCCARRNFWGC